jgi:hypothetical protein
MEIKTPYILFSFAHTFLFHDMTNRAVGQLYWPTMEMIFTLAYAVHIERVVIDRVECECIGSGRCWDVSVR